MKTRPVLILMSACDCIYLAAKEAVHQIRLQYITNLKFSAAKGAAQ